MPHKPKRPCGKPGCPELIETGAGGYCQTHSRQEQHAYEQQRGSAASRGYGSRWQKARAVFLAQHPLCAECAKENRTAVATVVDHIVPHKGDQSRFWDPSNWQPLCKNHHDTKTATEDGAFGNKQKNHL